MSIFHRKPKQPPARPELFALFERVRDANRVLIGWSVRSAGIEDLNRLLGEVERTLHDLAQDDPYARGWQDAMQQENPPEAVA